MTLRRHRSRGISPEIRCLSKQRPSSVGRRHLPPQPETYLPLSDKSDACPVPLTGNDPDTTVSNDCVALCDDNAPLSNPTPNFCTVEGNNTDSPDNSASDSENKVKLDRPSEDQAPGEENLVEPATAAPAEPERRSNRSTKQNDFHYPN